MSETEIILSKKVEFLENEFRKSVLKNTEQQLIIQQQQHRIEQLLRQLYGAKSERLSIQPNLFSDQGPVLPFTEEELQSVESEDSTKTVEGYQRKEIKKDPASLRFTLPEHLRREDVVIEPESLPEGAVKIGEEVSEKLEIKKSELYVRRTIRPKYALPNKTGIVIADLPMGPIYRCLAGPSLLTQILIDKYVDHLPLNRQIDRFARQGVKMKESTLCDWVSSPARLMELLYKEMTKEVLSSSYIGADETTIKVLDPKIRGKTHQGYFWVYLSHEKNLVIFDYDPTRKKGVPGEKLKNFKGYLQTDGYAGYEQFSTHEHIVRVGCMAHARRKFFEAQKNDFNRSNHALGMIQVLYRLEHLMRHFKLSNESKLKLRKRIALAELERIGSWMREQYKEVTPKSPIGNAIKYMLSRMEDLTRYTTDGQLHIDNNLVENKIRPVAIGRKNYMFMGSHDASQRSAMMYSFCQSCALNNINPEEWLEDVLNRINDTKASELHKLLPNNWAKYRV